MGHADYLYQGLGDIEIQYYDYVANTEIAIIANIALEYLNGAYYHQHVFYE